MKSKAKLFEALDEFFDTDNYYQTHKLKAVDNETFGKKSFIFVKAGDERRALEDSLTAKGFKVDRSYWPEGNKVMVQVSYFRGWHWDE